jgi:PAS domain S-box-containing protein
LCSRDATGELSRWNAALTDITDWKLAEEALRRSEEGYALAMEASGEGHWDWNIVTDEYHASPRMLELYGFPPGTTFKGRADFLARFPFHPDDRPRWDKASAAHFAGETARFDIEIRMIPHGEMRWIHLTGLLSRDASGNPVRWTGSVADITERKCAEDALRLSEQRYALAMEATGDGHWDWDIPSDKIYVSPLLLDICGLPPDTTFASQSEWVNRIPFYPGERPGYEQAVADHFAGKTVRLDVDVRIVPRGATRWVHLTGRCSRDASGKPNRWAGSVTDITARKRVAEELGARQDMLDLAQKVAHAVAFEWRVGAGEGENRWSPDLEAMYGIAAGSYDGTYESWKKLVYPEDWPMVRAAIKSAQESGDVAAEYRVVHHDGSIRWLQAKGRMFFDPGGKPTRVVGFMLDVTHRRHAEQELQRMEHQLRQAQRLEAMGTLAGGIAHDFNNLLGAILGYGEMALRDVPAGSRTRRDVENIMIAGERGRALVDRILAFSRSGVGERVAVHVEEVVGETLALFAAKLPRDIVIEQRLDAGGAAVMGDPTQIHQVLMNLLTNAVHAMPSGGTLHVSLDRVHVRAPRVAMTGTLAARDYVVMEVADTGSGIGPEILEKIFDPFFTTKEVGVGTGLGLSLVHGIVTGLGGVVDVATTVGKGSLFKAYLPLAGDVTALRKARKRLEPETRRAGHGHILLVDDEEALVGLATETLTGLGYTAVAFTASGAALDAFLADPMRFDAVITDESMPGASGSELIRKMRAIRPGIPILLVSGYLSAAVVQGARDAGATKILKKPLSAHQLASALDLALRATRTPPANDVALSPCLLQQPNEGDAP